jgi:hypothetical protein
MNRLACTLFVAAAFSSQALFGEEGFIDKTGKLVIEPRYANALDFSEGLGPVRVGAKCGYIDREGREKIPLKFDDARRFREGRAAVKMGDKWGFIDKEGAWVVEPTYAFTSDFSEGLAAVAIPDATPDDPKKTKAEAKEYHAEGAVYRVYTASDAEAPGGGWGFIDATGKLVIPHQFFDVRDFSNGRALVRPRGGRTIRLSAAEAAELKSRGSDYLQEHFVAQGDFTMEVAGYIDKTGAMVITPRFSTALPFGDGLAYVEQLDKHKEHVFKGYIDTSGKPVIELYRYAVRPSGLHLPDSLQPMEPIPALAIDPGPTVHKEGLALVDSGTGFVHKPKWTYVDTSGKTISENVGEFSSSFSEGLAAVAKAGFSRGKTGYVDRTGRLAIPNLYKAGGAFSEGLAPVQVDKLWGYIDSTGKVVIEPRFVWAASFSDGLARVKLRK